MISCNRSLQTSLTVRVRMKSEHETEAQKAKEGVTQYTLPWLFVRSIRLELRILPYR